MLEADRDPQAGYRLSVRAVNQPPADPDPRVLVHGHLREGVRHLDAGHPGLVVDGGADDGSEPGCVT